MPASSTCPLRIDNITSIGAGDKASQAFFYISDLGDMMSQKIQVLFLSPLDALLQCYSTLVLSYQQCSTDGAGAATNGAPARLMSVRYLLDCISSIIFSKDC